jgi:FkbM family methyltransferase
MSHRQHLGNSPVAPGAPIVGKQPVKVFGNWMILHDFGRDKWISPYLAAGRLFEPFETEWMCNLVRPGDTVLDIGGHIGFYTLLLARLAGPAGRVLSFEPDPVNFALLQQNVVLNRCANVSLYNLALSDKAGTTSLYLCSDNAGDHRLWPAAESRPTVQVATIALDQFLDPEQTSIRFIKMDIQGAEGAALEGMKMLLRRQSRLALMTEFWPFGMRGCGGRAEEFLRVLTELQFSLYLIDEREGRLLRVQPEQLLQIFSPNKDVFGNLLCIKTPALLEHG